MPHSVQPSTTKNSKTTFEAHGAPDSRWNSVRAILEAIPDPAWIITQEGQVRLANSAANRGYGYHGEEWRQVRFYELIGCQEDCFTSIQRILTEEGYHFFESDHRRKNGSTFQGEARLTLARVQRASVCIVIARDNTTLHVAEAAYRESQERFRQIFDSATMGMNTVVPEGFFLRANQAFCDFVGYQNEELQQLTIADLTYPDDRYQTEQLLEEVKSGKRKRVNLEKRFLRKDGTVAWGAVSATWMNGSDGAPEYGITLVQDITARKAIEIALRESEHKYRQVVDTVCDVLFQIDGEGRFVFLNPAWEKLTGCDIEQGLGLHLIDFVTEGFRDKVRDLCVAARQGEGGACRADVQFSFYEKSARWLALELFKGEQNGEMTGTLHDINSHKENEEKLELERQFLQTVIDGVVDPLLVIDLDHQVLMMNQTARKSGSPSNKESNTCYHLYHQMAEPCSGHYHPCPMDEVKRTNQPVTVVHYHTDNKGGQRIYEVQASPYRDQQGALCGIIEASRDITYLFEAEEQLREKETRLDYLVQHDILTNLPNRSHFYVKLRKAMKRAEQQSYKVGILLLDLDRFKNINESLGHDLGDRVLCEIAKRLCTTLRDIDTVARSGGDEFIIILDNIQEISHVDLVARKVLKGMAPQLDVDDYQLFVTGSLGISVYPDDGTDVEALMKAADTALFRAKRLGKNTYQFYTPDMNARSRELLLLEASLRRGIEEKQLVLHYQPQVDLFTGHLKGMEALVRWNHPERGMVSPGDFIPLAEETGLIVPMGEWVLREACKQNVRWQQLGFSPIRITVNISARQFLKGDLVKTVIDVLEETGLDPQDLELEITESMIMDDVETAIFIMEQLSSVGVHLAIDDFGTGYSSLAHLKRFPLSTLKIDRAFVKDLTTNSQDEAIVKAIVVLAHSLNMQVIAEGIETTEQFQFLKERGCEQGQGFLFSKPLPSDQLRSFLRPDPVS